LAAPNHGGGGETQVKKKEGKKPYRENSPFEHKKRNENPTKPAEEIRWQERKGVRATKKKPPKPNGPTPKKGSFKKKRGRFEKNLPPPKKEISKKKKAGQPNQNRPRRIGPKKRGKTPNFPPTRGKQWNSKTPKKKVERKVPPRRGKMGGEMIKKIKGGPHREGSKNLLGKLLVGLKGHLKKKRSKISGKNTRHYPGI